MFAKKRNLRKIVIGGAVASGILIMLLYSFVQTNLLAGELAVPWVTENKEVQPVDWTCLYFASFATAFFVAYFIPDFNWLRGAIGGIALSLTFTLACTLAEEAIFGIGFYFFCYVVWGLLFGRIITQKKPFIIRRQDDL